MTSFERAFSDLMRLEGGYVNHPNDPGGETKYGISKRSYPSVNIAELTEEQAQAIYRRDFWDRLRLDELNDPDIASELFEQAVNMGLGRAVVIAQKACNYLGERLMVDGRIGPLTLAALNHWSRKDKTALLKVLNGLQFMRYLELVNMDPKFKAFARGWLKRIVI